MAIKKMMMNKKILQTLFIIDIGVVIFTLLEGRYDWLLNTQIAFASSMMVTIGSYLGYKNNITKRVKDHQNDDDNYDELDKMDDKYDLYSPQVETKVIEDPTPQEIKEAIKPIKQNYFSNFKAGFSGMSSLYRLFGYIGLIIGFFYLNNNHLLDIYSYIFGFLIVPVSTIIGSFIISKQVQ